MGKAARNRNQRDREALKEKRLRRIMEWSHNKWYHHYPLVNGSTGGNGEAELNELTRDELRKLAAEREIAGRGSMTKAQLIEALSSAHGKSGES